MHRKIAVATATFVFAATVFAATVATVGLALVALPNTASAQPAPQPTPKRAPAKPTDLASAAAELQARVAKLEAQGETNTLAIAQISGQLAELKQRIDTLGNSQASGPDLVGRVDDVTVKTAALEREVETLRTELATLEQPYAAEGGGGSDGFTLSKGDYSATLTALLLLRWQLLTPQDFATITQSTFQIRTGRLGLKGKFGDIFGKKLTYRFQTEFANTPRLLDYYLDLELRPEVKIRFGQSKVLHGREFAVGIGSLFFHERSFVNGSYRYDRDAGVSVFGDVLGGRVDYRVGVTNGAGLNSLNDNIDFAVSGRAQVAAVGDKIGYTAGDIEMSPSPRLTLGVSAVHDLVRLPEFVGGTIVMERDVDGDDVVDNVRVLSLSGDATFRFKGIELGVEGYFRRESWGTILANSANEDLSNLIRASADGSKNHLGGIAHGSYFVWPKRIAVGARVGYSEQTYLGLSGLSGSRAPADQLFELAVGAQLYRKGTRLLGIDYSLTNYNSSVGIDPQFDIEHRFIIQSELAF